MSEEVVQWLAEIRALREQIAQLQNDLSKADESAVSWRQRYSDEAQQRRTEVKLSQQEIKRLKAEIKDLQRKSLGLKTEKTEEIRAIEAEVSQLQTVEQLQERLIEAIAARDNLAQALKLEQDSHEQTRQSLTAVIGDTIDQFSHQRSQEWSGVGD
ncbi:MAG: hypothetical protein SAJ37_10445 [Oscillatoria sp. PMC 1068.18]|nr:hypothetical protein [Oscillatoria sp. PMC 1076.18]MEC4989158.1 hypothetical protein [Oscillatoria sp. PMC 1068.18]